MNIDDALTQAQQQGSGDADVLRLVGTLAADGADGGIRVFPNPGDRSRWVLVARDAIAGEVLDVTEQVRAPQSLQTEPVFSVPVGRGAEIRLIAETVVTVDDPVKLRRLALDQSPAPSAPAGGGDCGCGCGGGGAATRNFGCEASPCASAGAGVWPCRELDGGNYYCSTCCAAAAPFPQY